MVSFGDDDRPADNANQAWEHLPAIERGIRRVLRLAGPIDVLHLRMADVGTMAGASVAAEIGIPVCFSVAPDPHNVIESLQARGELDDESFVRLATDTHVWFRARLIEGVARDANQLALFPRSKQIDFLDGLEANGEDQRQSVAVVAEGIDISLLDRVGDIQDAVHGDMRSGDVLDDLATGIPPSRRDLPLVLSVGRLNPIKGMDRVVAAWAGDPRLHDHSNLVIVGGDLANPSATEAAVLAVIDRLVPATDPRRAGIVLLGGRPRADVARLLVAAVSGRAGGWAAGGVYVDGAVKEEFGLAVLEAMAAGLVVVAPSTGGPSTYVDDGDTGVLVAPRADLGRGNPQRIRAGGEERAGRTCSHSGRTAVLDRNDGRPTCRAVPTGAGVAMSLLVISPDFTSHYGPLAVVAGRSVGCRASGGRGDWSESSPACRGRWLRVAHAPFGRRRQYGNRYL